VNASARRLAALAAALAPDTAARLLARGPDPGAAAEATRLARAPRAERLRALSAALVTEGAAGTSRAPRPSPERARIAALAAAPGAPVPDVAPLILRLLREARS
jgi:hypothetical protein